ncbi:hypothetical protein DVH24_025924 [Malus domestica]|uniref:Uncharacterized protein n=1 Tax=Malus domestica TaxID=3750 RepID=A0A498KGI5_MALDO|nr:hypothetical protein DVH24_025924 [Malus domestica]
MVLNVHVKDDRKLNLDLGLTMAVPKKKEASDSKSPSVMHSREETLDPVIEKENEKPKEPENKPKKKETKKKATEKMTKWEKNSNALQIQGYTRLLLVDTKDREHGH